MAGKPRRERPRRRRTLLLSKWDSSMKTSRSCWRRRTVSRQLKRSWASLSFATLSNTLTEKLLSLKARQILQQESNLSNRAWSSSRISRMYMSGLFSIIHIMAWVSLLPNRLSAFLFFNSGGKGSPYFNQRCMVFDTVLWTHPTRAAISTCVSKSPQSYLRRTMSQYLALVIQPRPFPRRLGMFF